MKTNRMAAYGLLLIFVFLALEYVWLQSPREPGRARRGRGAHFGSMRQGCPADAGDRKDLGATDYAWSIKTLDGAEVAFSQFRGKSVFVNVWATWCGPCVDEMPDIEALWQSMSAHGDSVAFVLLSEEEAEPVRKFVEEQALSAPIYITTGPLPDVFESRGVPATFIVDPQGTIVFRRTGAASWNNDACRNYLRELAEPSATASATHP